MTALLRSILILLALSSASACRKADVAAASRESDWPSWGRGPDETHFSPTDQISAANVGRLRLAWHYDIPGSVLASSTPLEVAGKLYTTTGYSVIRAFEARSGRLLWTYDPEVAAVAGLKLRAGWGSRGIGYDKGRIFVATHDGRLIALDAAKGIPIWSVMTVGADDPRYITGAPRIFGDKVVIGHAGADIGAVRGYVTAYDARTGRQLWRFYTVPGDPAKGFESPAMAMAAKTWSGHWWRYGGGGTVWNAIAYDPDLHLIYIGTGNGAPWNRKIRSDGRGDNLFLASIVALDADTGAYRWHYQVNPGESWDYNACMDMTLATLTIDGRQRKVLMQAPKNGFFYVIDRVTGKLISAQPFAKVTWASRVDLATGRPVEAPNIRYEKGPATIWPGPGGAHNWQPMAFSPGTGLVYIPVFEMPGTYSDRDIDLTRWSTRPGMVPNFGVNYKVGDVPPTAGRSMLIAWDPVHQRKVWSVPTPGVWNGGVLATKGNLVFQGRADGKFVAYAADTGRQLWSFDAQAGIIGAPIAYVTSGHEYVSIIVGYAGGGTIFGTMSAQFGWSAREQSRRVLTFSLGGQDKLPAVTPSKGPRVSGSTEGGDPVGHALYDAHCVMCHGAAGISGGHAPDLRASPLIAQPSAFNAIVQRGALESAGMPKFGELSESQLNSIRFYLAKSSKVSGSAALKR